MDTITQAVLGAAVAQASVRHKLGARVLVWGAIGGLLPDLDVLAVAVVGPFGEMAFHRGFTHSLFFGPIFGPLIGYGLWRYYRRRAERGYVRDATIDMSSKQALYAWMWVMFLALFTHPLLDYCTTYGTQLLWPFSDHRFANDGMPIIDPVYTLMLVAGLLGYYWYRIGNHRPLRAAQLCLLLSTLYLGYGYWLNQRAEVWAKADLESQGYSSESVDCFPTLLQVYLRRCVAYVGDEVLVSYPSMLVKPKQGDWLSYKIPSDPVIDLVLDTPEGRLFRWFARDHVVPLVRVESVHGNTHVELADVRYGIPGVPEKGLWGIKAVVNREGQFLGPIERFSEPRPDIAAAIAGLWRLMWGEPFSS